MKGRLYLPLRFLKYSAFVVGAVLLLVFLCGVFVTLPPGERFLRGIVEAQVSGILNQKIEIGRLETNLISRVQFEDISVQPMDPDSGGIYIPSLRVSYGFRSLLSKTLEIRSVEIDSPRIRIVHDTERGFNIALLDSITSPRQDAEGERVPPKETRGGGWKIELGPVRIDGMLASYVDTTFPMSASLNELSLMADGFGAHDLSFSLDGGSGRIKYGPYAEMPLNLHAEGNWRDGLIISDSTRIVLGDLVISARGSVGINDSNPVDLLLKVHGDPSLLLAGARQQFKLDKFQTDGLISMTADLSGNLPIPDGYVRAELPAVSSPHLSFDQTLLVVRHHGDSVFIDTLNTWTLEGNLSARGYLLADSFPDGMFEMSIESVSMARLWEALHDRTSPYEGSITGNVDVATVGDNWRGWTVGADLKGKNLRYDRISLEELTMSLGLDEGRLTAEVYQDYFRVEGDIALGESSIRGTLSADVARLEPLAMLFDLSDVKGAMSLQADLDGSFSDPIVRAQLNARDLLLTDIPIDTLAGKIQFAGMKVAAESLLIRQDNLLMQANASLDLKSMSGDVAAAFYDRNRDKAHQAQDSRHDTSDLPERHVPYVPIGYIESAFKYSGGNTFSIDATGHGFQLSVIEIFIEDMPFVSGVADFRIVAQGPPSVLLADVTLSIDQPKYLDILLDSLTLEGSFNAGTVDIRTLTAYRLDQSLRSELFAELADDSRGFWKVTPQTRTRGTLEVTKFDLGMLKPLLPEDADIAGMASLDLQWDGTIVGPGVTGSVNVDSASYVWSKEDTAGITNVTIAGTIADSTLSLDTARALVNDVAVSLGGSVSMLPANQFRIDVPVLVDNAHTVIARGTLSPEHLDVTTEIDSLNARILEPFVVGLERLGGYITATAHLSGRPDNLDVSGMVRAAHLEATPTLLDAPITDGRLAASFTQSTLDIDTLFARVNTGTIRSSGKVVFDTSGISDISLTLAADKLDFAYRDYLQVRVQSADLSWELKDDYYQLGGEVDLGRVRYTQNFQPTAILPFTQQVQVVETELPELLARSRLNLKIVRSDSVWVDNNLAHLRANADLQFIGFLARPNISGRLSIEEGYVLYLDRKFTVTEGVAFFTDPNQINPEVSLRAVADVTTYRQIERTKYEVALTITGRIQSPTVGLSSQPPLSRPDIISVLTLGATRAELAGETGGVLQERAEVIASRQISQYASRELGETLGLDSVTVTGNIFDVKGGSGPEVIIAQEVMKDVTVTYRTNVGHLNEQRVSIDWELSNHWLLEGTTTRNGESALSITYALRFR
jgi:autotransporter translocation and assembly factor TamB